MRELGAAVVDVGMVDNPEKARLAASSLRKEEVEILFLYNFHLCLVVHRFARNPTA